MTPRFRINRDGTATLAGVPYWYMRDILTMAALHWYDERDDGRYTDPESVNWNRNSKWFMDELEKSMKESIAATHRWPKDFPAQTLKQRLQRRNEERQIINRLMNKALEEMRARKTSG